MADTLPPAGLPSQKPSDDIGTQPDLAPKKSRKPHVMTPARWDSLKKACATRKANAEARKAAKLQAAE